MPKQPKTTIAQLQTLGYVLYSPKFGAPRITLDAVGQPDGSMLWAIRRGDRSCYNRRTKLFDYEPSSSNRTERYYKTHRFTTIDDALKAWDSYKKTQDYAVLIAIHGESQY